MQGKMMFIHALTPIHTGTGQSVDVIDLPIAREKTTGWPLIPGSSIKGVLRDACDPGRDASDEEKRLFIDVFGPDTNNAAGGAGSLIFCDAHLLCLPVRSFFGTFAWVTCPGALGRLIRDYTAAELDPPFQSVVQDPGTNQALVCHGSKVRTPDGDKLILEDLDFNVDENSEADTIARKIDELVFARGGSVAKRLTIVSDDMFSALTETCTEVSARIKMNDESKTVQKGGLWYEEAVPSEAIFWLPVLAAPRNGQTPESLFGFLTRKKDRIGYVQIGGHATVGRGIARVIWEVA